MPSAMLDITTLSQAYRSGQRTPLDVMEVVLARIEAYPDKAVFPDLPLAR